MQYIHRYIFDIYLYLPSYLSAQKKLLKASILLKNLPMKDQNGPGLPLVALPGNPVKTL
jgi:hypothetical protein